MPDALPATPTDVLIAALIGLLAGGGLNLLADYLPFTARIRGPRYPDGTPRPLIASLGLTAYLFGRRKGPDGKALSVRHPLAELVTAGLFAAVAANSATPERALFVMGCVFILNLITIIDLEHRMILYIVVFPAYVYALIGAALLTPLLDPRIQFQDYLIGGALGFIVFGGMYLGGLLFSRVVAESRGEPLEEVAFGDGDVLLAILAGLMLGWQAFIFAVTFAVLAGAAGALVYMAARVVLRGRYEAFTALPYGQYIVFGTLIMLLWRAPVIAFFFRMGG